MPCPHPKLSTDQTAALATVWAAHLAELRKSENVTDDELSAAYDIRRVLAEPPEEVTQRKVRSAPTADPEPAAAKPSKKGRTPETAEATA